MDIQRYLLIAASLLLSIMLLGEWTAFKEANRNQADRPRLTAGTVTETTTTIEELSPVNVDESIEQDLPDVANLEPAQDFPVTTNHFVTVKTDALEVVINLKGGDIIETALPAFPETIDNPDVPFVILEQNQVRTYVAQSGFVGKNGFDTPERASYTTDNSLYTLTDNSPLDVALTLQGTNDDIHVVKTFTFHPGSYLIDVNYTISNSSDSRWEATPFAQLKRDSSLPPGADSSGFGMQPFLGAATTTDDDRFKKFSFGDLADESWKADQEGGWIALLQHYFLSAWVPSPDRTHKYFARQTAAGVNLAGFTSPTLTVDPGTQGHYRARLYVGPKDQYALAEISPHLELTVDYGWLWWIAQPLFWLLTKIQSLVNNWGLAIILLTVLVKGAFFQLSAASYKSMAKMRKVQPKMQSIREQYAEDKQKQSQAMMELYKKEKINPMGGCLPILIQMPVFIALYWVLMESVELRQAPFALWIDDLSVMDPYFVLPLLMGASMFFMQKLNPPPPDPMQAKIMQWLPVVFTFFFLWFPAGLVLYWVVNNLLSMAQQWVITRRIEREGTKA